MFDRISQMEPLLPSASPELADGARQVVSRSASLAGSLHPVTRKTITEFLRITNSYYSNLIEGHGTHPVDIERAMRKDYSTDPAKRNLQLESLAHIECQRRIEERLEKEPDVNISSPEFIKWLHGIFYEQLPHELRLVRNDETGETMEVVPGEIRHRAVKVGRHVGPREGALPRFLDRFGDVYRLESYHGIEPLLVAPAAHHRLAWIHPFLDGNGRVARLHTDAWFMKLPLSGYGLWNISRGIARQRSAYIAALAQADAPRQGALDGRGNLSEKGLTGFCEFFLGVCLDQIDYMGRMLDLDALLGRIQGYVNLRKEKSIAAPSATSPPLRKEAVHMLQETLLRGEVPRGDAIRCSGMAERTGRKLLGQLQQEGLLVSDTPKGPVRLGLPASVAGYFFPDLYPDAGR